MPTRLWKLDGRGDRYLPAEALSWPAERFMQTYSVDLARFRAVNPSLDLGEIESVAVRFEGSGDVYIDDVAFEPSR